MLCTLPFSFGIRSVTLSVNFRGCGCQNETRTWLNTRYSSRTLAGNPSGIDGSHVSNNLPIAPLSTYPHRSCNDMSFRESLSRLRKKAKEKLSKIGEKRNEQPAGAGSEGFDRSSLSLQSDKSDWKHTTSSAAKLFLRTVKETSDAFPPLKSVAGGLCAILDNCEVRSTFVRLSHDAYRSHSELWSTSRR